VSTAVLHDLPLPARLAPWPRASRTTLVRCLWLAALLHLLALLWLGSAPEGTAPPGLGVQGRLNVTLRGPGDDGLASLPPMAPPPQAGTADAGAAPRIGGAVRDTAPPADTAPGAARLGEAAPLPEPAPAAPPPEPLPAALAPAPVPPAPPEPVLRPLAPATPLPAPVAAVPALARPPAAAPAVAAALPALPQLAPLPAAPVPAPEGRLEAGALRQLLPGPAAPLQAPAPATPAALPSTPLSPLAELPAGPAAPGPAVPPVRPSSTPGTAAGATQPSPTASPAADAGPRLGADVALPAIAASAPRPLNLELGRLRGGELSRLGAPGVLPVLPRPPETDKLASEIEKAGRPDCTRAYAGAGLLAVVPLAVDAVRGKGCKW
jgi:hypothetical protein